MENLLHFIFSSAFVALLIYFCLFHLKWPIPYQKSRCTAPQAGGAWPIIGHLHLFGGQQLIHKTLAAMADQYGPVFTIKLGSHTALVLSSSESVRECFTVFDKVFCTRPCIAASKFLGYDFAMFGFTPYGPYWREIRKIATIELLSTHRLNSLNHIRRSEVETAITELYDLSINGTKRCVDMKRWFGELTLNIALRMVGGKRNFGAAANSDGGEERNWEEIVREYTYLFGVFVVSDAIPWLGWLDLNGYEKAMKRIAKKLDGLIAGWLAEHKEKRAVVGGEEEKKNEGQDFMDVMLEVLDDSNIFGYDADTVIKATCLNLILAGNDTTTIALTWALSLLLNNPHALRKAQNELDAHVGKDRRVEESDIKNLIYLQAIVKETLRLYPPSPIIGLHSAMEDCTLSAGYRIPAGTRLMVNVWKIHRDDRVWADPLQFKPERFVNMEVDLKGGQSFEIIPFGAGRRSCPGAALALQVVHLALANLLHGFDIGKPSDEAVDMTESPGLTNLKATPLEALLTPRLNACLYGFGLV